jgi:hypothetical protein
MSEANLRRRSPLLLIGLVLVLPINFAAVPSWSADPPPAPAAATAPTNLPVFDSERIYQGRGGDIHFTVSGDIKSQPDMHACLRWKPRSPPAAVPAPPPEPPCDLELPVRRIKEIPAPPGAVYAVTIPRGFLTAPDGTDYRFRVVPVAELAISTSGGSAAKWRVVREIGVTSRGAAALMAVLAVVAAGAILYRFAIYLNVPGPEIAPYSGVAAVLGHALRGFSVPLRLISTGNGWASLSQFQIILWTFVVGAGAVYVISLTGSLIAISGGALALLGIAGGATVLSEVKNQQSQSSPTLALPGAVTNLAPVGQANQTKIVIAWSPPNSGGTPTAYLVQYEDPAAAGVWRTASRALRATSLRIVGLAPGTAYRVRVLASNAAGTGADVTIPAPTAAAQLPAASVIGLQMRDGRTATSIPLEWVAVPNAAYVLEQRPHDSDSGWTAVALAAPAAANATVPNLAPNTAYDFRVRTNAAPGAWSSVVTFGTGVRTPKWSDIVTDTDRPAEIDVTRVQMLFFTVISAFFVALNIADAGVIPDIDPTYVTLMGISNGVYLTAKFVRA